MMADLIVFGSLGLAGAFAAAWAVSPRLRARTNRPTAWAKNSGVATDVA